MRLRVCLDNPDGTRLPIDYQHHLTEAVYGLLAALNADYAHFLHEMGYASDDGPKRFKLFVFSWLHGRHRVDGITLYFAPGLLVWQIASPLYDYLTHSATGLLADAAPKGNPCRH